MEKKRVDVKLTDISSASPSLEQIHMDGLVNISWYGMRNFSF